MPRFFLITVLSLLPWLTMAETTKAWHCTAKDDNDKEWNADHTYERTAQNLALEACKKESPTPGSCKAPEDSCDYFGKEHLYGKKSKYLWRCTAMDEKAKFWRGKPSHHKDEAALDAKALCQEHSARPDSCYVNLFTCRAL